jgi:hypothetical protein
VETLAGTYFKLKRSWLTEPGFFQMICSWWRARKVQGSAIVILSNKLAGLRVILKEYGSAVTLVREQRRREALSRIQELDSKEAAGILSEDEQADRKVWQGVVLDEDLKQEIDSRERSKQLWLKEGDANTKFFHLAASSRRRFSFISSILCDGHRVTSNQEIKSEAIRFFREASRATRRGKWRMAGDIGPRVTSVQAEQLTALITE